MPLTDNARNVGLNAQAAVIPFIGAASAYPGAGGANELSGGAYARQSITWAAASGADLDDSNVPVIPIPAGATVAWIMYWSAVSAGTYQGCSALNGGPMQPFTADATDLITCPGHGYSAGNQVVFFKTSAGALPTGLVEGTIYYVIASGLTTDAFKVSATSGGSAVDITNVKSGVVQSIVPEVFGNPGNLTLNDADIFGNFIGV